VYSFLGHKKEYLTRNVRCIIYSAEKIADIRHGIKYMILYVGKKRLKTGKVIADLWTTAQTPCSKEISINPLQSTSFGKSKVDIESKPT